MVEVVSRAELEMRSCDNPTCTAEHSILYIQCQKHPHYGTTVYYDKELGQAVVQCQVCGNELVAFCVAEDIPISPGCTPVK